MHLKSKIIAVLSIAAVTVAALFASRLEMTGASQDMTGFSLFDRKETIYFWYSDDTMTDFINSAAVSFGEARGVRVIPKLTSDSEYLEAMNQASLHSEQVPDVYMISNDSLEKAFMAGLASPIQDVNGICNTEHFPMSALSAVTYKDKLVAYPFFYETSALLFNETYLQAWAAQQAANEAEESGVALDEAALSQRTADYMAAAIPATIDDIVNIADTFDVPEGVEGVMKWDVSDIFYNYWMVGNYMIIGGDAGDNEGAININNPETIQCLETYKGLNQFFYIESDKVTYESVINEFMEGKSVFTIATTDAVKLLEEAKAAGTIAFDYGFAILPSVSPELASRSLSVTSAIAVNGYSEKKELANAFAAYLTNDYAEDLYERTGKMSSNLGKDIDRGPNQIFMQQYAASVSLPKMVETGNFWIQLEILFSKIWNGADVPTLVGQLSEQILSQVSGGIS